MSAILAPGSRARGDATSTGGRGDAVRATDTMSYGPEWAARMSEDVVGNAWATDAAGRFVYITPSMLALLGIAPKELNTSLEDPALGWKPLVHPDDYEAAATSWQEGLQTGHAYDVTDRLRAADGTYRWGRCSGRPGRDAEARIVGWYGTALDREVLPTGHDPVLVEIYRDGLAAGAPSSFNIVHPDDRSEGVTDALWTGLPHTLQLRLRQADGDFRWTETILEPPRHDAEGILQRRGATNEIGVPKLSRPRDRALTMWPDTEAEIAIRGPGESDRQCVGHRSGRQAQVCDAVLGGEPRLYVRSAKRRHRRR